MNDFKFSTLQYERPDFAKFSAFEDEMLEKIKNANSYEELQHYITKFDKANQELSTICTIASIRHTLDTTDKFYEQEDEYINDMIPTLIPQMVAINDAILNSKFRDDVEKEFGKQYFTAMELQKKAFCEENIPLMQQEAKLTNEYQKIMATAAIEFHGETLNLYGVQKYFEACAS
ncbi:MAG: hypothetical protein ACLRZ7_00735 [Lachnospiraceae bacterium]